MPQSLTKAGYHAAVFDESVYNPELIKEYFDLCLPRGRNRLYGVSQFLCFTVSLIQTNPPDYPLLHIHRADRRLCL